MSETDRNYITLKEFLRHPVTWLSMLGLTAAAVICVDSAAGLVERYEQSLVPPSADCPGGTPVDSYQSPYQPWAVIYFQDMQTFGIDVKTLGPLQRVELSELYVVEELSKSELSRWNDPDPTKSRQGEVIVTLGGHVISDKVQPKRHVQLCIDSVTNQAYYRVVDDSATDTSTPEPGQIPLPTPTDMTPPRDGDVLGSVDSQLTALNLALMGTQDEGDN